MKHLVVSERSSFKLEPPSGKLVVKEGDGVKELELVPSKEVDERIPYPLLNPIQSAFYRYYEGGSALVSAPTSAGKSLTAFLFLREKKGPKVFTAPTRALVYEKARELSKLFGLRADVRTGEVVELFKGVKSELVVATYESLALALRNKAPWAVEAGGVVVDEVHQLMGSRGWVLEELLAFLLEQGTPVLGLSATLPGAEELARWIKAELFLESRWRPVPLERRVIPLKEFPEFTAAEDQEERFAARLLSALFTLKEPDEQVILFVHKKSVGWTLLELAAKEKLGIMNETTPFEKEEREPYEIAFHNADVPKEEREKIEKAFREGKLPVLVATSTLAYGVNLPADTVLIGVRAFYDRLERSWKIRPDLLDVLQMEGRAGRLGIKERGRSFILPFGVKEETLKRELERKLEEPFRPHLLETLGTKESDRVLALFILIGYLYEGESYRNFLRRTYSLRNLADAPKVEELFLWLKEHGFIEEGRLTQKALLCVKTGLPPFNYEEFLRRRRAGLEEPVWLRPLMFVKRFDGLYEFIKKSERFEEDFLTVKERLLPCGNECFRDNTEWFLFYWEGLTFFYPNLRHPPGEFSYLGTDALHLLRLLFEIKKAGDLELEDRELIALAHGVKYGLSKGFYALGGIKGVGHVRANLVKRLLLKEGLEAPPLGAPTEELLELLTERFGPNFEEALFELLLNERYGHERYKDAAAREARTVASLLRRNRKGLLVDDRILRVAGLFKLGERAVRMRKRELAEELLR
ncbi:MAG: DEAD/DEAH box helicase [Aquificae bacterium]|nr:DEAD/DEAH box helicase [Aquificota bacterium]